MNVLPQLTLNDKPQIIAKLDVKDKKILFCLSQNARAPLTTISKNVALSRDSVKYRISNYEKQGILKKSRTLVNVAKLGYDSYHIFLRLNNPSKEKEGEIIEKISGLSFIRAILKFFGSFDLEIAVIAKNINEFDSHLTKIVSIVKDNIQDYEILIISNTYCSGPFPNSFLKDIKKHVFKFASERIKNDEYKPDKKDFEIIKLIRDDAQMSLIDIADKIKLSADAVSYRIKKLMKSVIIAFVPVINYKSIGYNIHALLVNISSLDEHNEKRLSNFLESNDDILWAVKTLGRYNLLIYTCTTNDIELQKTISELRNLFPEQINRYESLLAFEEYKYTYAPDCIFEIKGS